MLWWLKSSNDSHPVLWLLIASYAIYFFHFFTRWSNQSHLFDLITRWEHDRDNFAKDGILCIAANALNTGDNSSDFTQMQPTLIDTKSQALSNTSIKHPSFWLTTILEKCTCLYRYVWRESRDSSGIPATDYQKSPSSWALSSLTLHQPTARPTLLPA